jgi:predicted MFS family arabinose efflux permease
MGRSTDVTGGHDADAEVMTTHTSAATTSQREPLLTRAFVMLLVAELAYFTADGVAIYTLPLHVTGPLGSGPAAAGVAFGAFAVSALLLRPVAGRLSDRYGRGPLLVGGAALAGVGLALTAHADSLTVVVLLRLVLGVAEAAFFVAGVAALADLAPPSRMGEAISYNSLGLYLGLTFGPPLGELLVESWGFRTAWYGAAGLAVVAAGLALRIGETRPAGASVGRSALIHRRSIAPGLAFMTSLVAMGGFLSLASLHGHEIGFDNASIPMFVFGATVVTCRTVFAKVPDRVPSLALGSAALTTMGCGLLVMVAWATPVGAVVGAFVLAVGISFSTPAFFSAVLSTARPAERGAAAGTASAFMDLGLGGGPILLGAVAEASGIPGAFAAGAAVAIAGAAWSLHLHLHARR